MKIGSITLKREHSGYSSWFYSHKETCGLCPSGLLDYFKFDVRTAEKIHLVAHTRPAKDRHEVVVLFVRSEGVTFDIENKRSQNLVTVGSRRLARLMKNRRVVYVELLYEETKE